MRINNDSVRCDNCQKAFAFPGVRAIYEQRTYYLWIFLDQGSVSEDKATGLCECVHCEEARKEREGVFQHT